LTETAVEYCGRQGTLKFAGVHLIIELWRCRHLDNLPEIERILRRAVDDCGATLLHMHLHEFTPNGGVSGAGILQESHISIHTWPEYDYAALDLFVCGTCDPHLALPAIKEGFQPGDIQLSEIKRGLLP
jgi:S-adenosylmethionine decarboxylase